MGHRHLPPAVVTGAVGVLHLGAPGDAAADPHGAAARLIAASPRPAGAAHHHALAPVLLPGHHLHLGGDHQLRCRRPEQHLVQLSQHFSRRNSLSVHYMGEMGGTDASQLGRLILAVPMRIHPVPQSAWVHGGTLGGLNPDGSIEHGLHPRLDRRAQTPLASGCLGDVGAGHSHQFRQLLQAQTQLPGPLPDEGTPALDQFTWPVGALGRGDFHRTAQRLLNPCLDLRAHVPSAPGHLGDVVDAHARQVRQVLLGQAQGAGLFPDAGALAFDQAALAVDHACPGTSPRTAVTLSRSRGVQGRRPLATEDR